MADPEPGEVRNDGRKGVEIKMRGQLDAVSGPDIWIKSHVSAPAPIATRYG